MRSHTQFEGSQNHWLVTQSREGMEVIVISQDVIVKITQRQYVKRVIVKVIQIHFEDKRSHCKGHIHCKHAQTFYEGHTESL